MLLLVILLLLGLLLVVLGADWLVDGASAVARRTGISEFVIGLTIVSIGTSAPELVVSTVGALGGNPTIALGNVIGSNIMNVLLILGVTAIIAPISFTKGNKSNSVFNIAASAIVLLLAFIHFLFKGDFVLPRIGGAILILLFALYMFNCFRTETNTIRDHGGKSISILKAVLLIVGGLAALVFGGRMLVHSAVDLAHELGVSEKFVAVTIIAGGTSLPELVTCVVAALKKKSQMALGNIIGSNIFNILLILGCASLMRGIPFDGVDWIDVGVFLFSGVLLLLTSYTGHDNKISRSDGAFMLGLWILYMGWLFIRL